MLNMAKMFLVCALFVSLPCGGLFAQKKAAGPTQRYYRLICLVHLIGSGKAGDPILPEYVAQGTATAQAAMPTAAVPQTAGIVAEPKAAANAPVAANAATALSSRPGFLAWSMQRTDDGTMAIVHIVATDPTAFAPILADTRPEIRVFQIGKDSKAAIEAALQQYKKGFTLDSLQVFAQ